MAHFNPAMSKSPCVEYLCKQHNTPGKDKNDEACITCQARWQYLYAIEGDPVALEYFKNLDPETLGISIDRPVNEDKKKSRTSYYEKKYFPSASIIAKEKYGKDFASLHDILFYTYQQVKIKNKVEQIYNISKGTIKYICDIYGIKTVGGMKQAMQISWDRRKGRIKT